MPVEISGPVVLTAGLPCDWLFARGRAGDFRTGSLASLRRMTSPQAPGHTPAGWYPDPNGSAQQRYWDGAQWTEHYAAPAAQGAPPQAPGIAAQPKAPPTPAPSAWWAVPVLAVLALIGCAGRWVSADLGGTTINKTNGLDGDGTISLVLVIIAVVLLVVWRANGQRWAAVVAAVMAGIATLLPLIYIIDPATGAEGFLVDQADFSTGWGAYLAFLASGALTVLSVVFATKRRRA